MGKKVTLEDLVNETEVFVTGIMTKIEEDYGEEVEGFILLKQYTESLAEALTGLGGVADAIVLAIETDQDVDIDFEDFLPGNKKAH